MKLHFILLYISKVLAMYIPPYLCLFTYTFVPFFGLLYFESKAGFENNQLKNQLACLIKKRLGVRTIYDISLSIRQSVQNKIRGRNINKRNQIYLGSHMIFKIE